MSSLGEAPIHSGHHGHHGRHGRHEQARWLTILGIALALVSAIAVIALVVGKHASSKQKGEERSREVDRGPSILVAKAVASPATRDLTLPAEIRGYFQTTEYAKISGYVRDVKVDKGTHVTRGEVLGTIESPETDQVVRAAQSDLILRKQTYARARRLTPSYVTQEDFDTAHAQLLQSEAGLKSALAQQGYEIIRAPFDGVVTMRYVDPGALLPAGTGSTASAQPFVDVADPTHLRIDAYVGQESALHVHAGDPVTITQDGTSEQVETAVTRTSDALDPRTRTMLCEVELDNRKPRFLPGTFAKMTLHIPTPVVPLVPAEAVVLRRGAPFIAIVRGDRVRLTKVDVGQTDGRTTAITSGLQVGELVALDLPIEVEDGARVRAKERPAEDAGAGDAGK